MAGRREARPTKKAAICSHPAFPAIVALWFATLLGFGSLVLPSILFENVVNITGISSLVPAAAPPLGAKARMLIAVIAGLMGVFVGLFVARKIVASQSVANTKRKNPPELRNADRHPDAPAKRPVSAREELGTNSLDDDIEDEWADDDHELASFGRRRPLAVTEEVGRSEYLDMAPLPGGVSVGLPSEAEMAAMEPQQAAAVDHTESVAPISSAQDEPLDLDHLAEPDPIPAGNERPFAPIQQDFAAQANAAQGAHSSQMPASSLTSEFQEMSQQSTAQPQIETANEAEAPMPPALAKLLNDSDFDAPNGEEEQYMSDQLNPARIALQGTQYNPLRNHAAEPEDANSAFESGAYRPEPQSCETVNAQAFATDRPAVAHAAQTAGESPAPFAAPMAESVNATASVADFSRADLPNTDAATAATTPIGDRPLGELGMAELVARFAQSLEREKLSLTENADPQHSAHDAANAEDSAESPLELPAFAARDTDILPSAAVPVDSATEPMAAMADAQVASVARENLTETAVADEPIPAAFRPLDFDAGDEDDTDTPDLSLRLNATSPRPFAGPQQNETAQPAPFADPVAAEQAAPLELNVEEEALELNVEDKTGSAGEDSGYSSLLDMKRPLGSGRETVRIDDDGDESRDLVEPVVVFPGEESRKAAPAADGPSREPIGEPMSNLPPEISANPIEQPAGGTRLFDGPAAPATDGGAQNGFSGPAGALPAADPAETEKALRDALEKLNRMSGAA